MIVEGEEFRIIQGRVYKLTGKCDPTRCNAFCCRHLYFVVDKVYEDDSRYFRAHGCEVKEIDGKLHILVPSKCVALNDADKRCMIYHTRPRACYMFADRDDLVFRPPLCTLKWKEIKGRKADLIIRKMRER